MFLPVSVALRVLQLELAKAALRSTEDVLHRHDLQGHSVGGRLVHRVLSALERSRLLDYDEEQQDDEDVEEDYETNVPSKWPSLAYQLLLVSSSFLLQTKVSLIPFQFCLSILTGQSLLPSQIWALLITLYRSSGPQYLKKTKTIQIGKEITPS